MQAAMAPPVDQTRSCSDSTKILQLVQYVIAVTAAAVLCIITPLVTTLDCSAVGIPVDEKSCAPI